MGPTIRQSEAEKESLDAEHIAKDGRDRNAATFPDECRFAAKSAFQCALRCLSKDGMRISQIPRAVVAAGAGQRNAAGKVLLQMLLRQPNDIRRALVRDEPKKIGRASCRERV